jgi:hypothetical protein
MHRSYKWFLSLRSSYKNPVLISVLPHMNHLLKNKINSQNFGESRLVIQSAHNLKRVCMEHHKMPYSGKFQHSVLGINKIVCSTSQLYHCLGTAHTSVIGHSAPWH